VLAAFLFQPHEPAHGGLGGLHGFVRHPLQRLVAEVGDGRVQLLSPALHTSSLTECGGDFLGISPLIDRRTICHGFGGRRMGVRRVANCLNPS